MARKQSDYLAALLADDEVEVSEVRAPAPAREAPPERARATTLLGRESALARVASGEVRQVTQLLRDPFGRAQQDHAAGDQYPTPPSNADNLFWFRV